MSTLPVILIHLAQTSRLNADNEFDYKQCKIFERYTGKCSQMPVGCKTLQNM